MKKCILYFYLMKILFIKSNTVVAVKYFNNKIIYNILLGIKLYHNKYYNL